jgi:hypothetical protein
MEPATSQVSAKNKTSVFRGEEIRRRHRFLERLAIGLTVAFCGVILFAIWYSDGRVLDSPIKFLQSFESKDAQAPRNYAQNCRDPRNKNLPYCQDKIAQTEAEWRSMSRTQGGKTNHFTLGR